MSLDSHTIQRGSWAASVKLGKLPPRHDSRTLQLGRYLTKIQPGYAPFVNWEYKVRDWGMMLNDQLGDCTIATVGHQVQGWTDYAGAEVVIPDAQILHAYEKIGGYVPNNPATDNGCVILDVLNYWRKTGIGGHKIAAYVKVDPQNESHVKTAIELFGSLYIGVGLPATAQNQNGTWWVDGDPTDPNGSAAPYSWGGHAVPIMCYSKKVYSLVTWGQNWYMAPGFLHAYCDEAYAIVTQDWIAANGASPSGFNLQLLLADLAEVTN